MQWTFVRRAAAWLGRPTFAAKYIVVDVFRKLPPKNLGLTSHEVYERALKYNASAELAPLPKWANAPHEEHSLRSMRYLKKFILDNLEKEGFIVKMTVRRARELMQLDEECLKSDGLPGRKDKDFVWMLTHRGRTTAPIEPDEPEADEMDDRGAKDAFEQHPISRNARRRRMRELRARTHRRPAREQLEKLRASIYGDWMSHSYTSEEETADNFEASQSQTSQSRKSRGPSPILKKHPEELERRSSSRERKSNGRQRFMRRSPTLDSGRSTWLERRALLTPRLPRSAFE